MIDRTAAENNLRAGSIVYDQTTRSFWGLDSSGGWAKLGTSPAASVWSEIHYVDAPASPNGFGSSETKIRKFVNQVTSTGTAVSYSSTSSTQGDTFTINEDGVYTMTYCDGKVAGGVRIGISRNLAGGDFTTNVDSISTSKALVVSDITSGAVQCVTSTAGLVAGDVIRAHSDGAADRTGLVRFSIVKTEL